MGLMEEELHALEAPWAVAAREDPALLFQICHALQGPVHVLNPARFGENLTAFQEAFRQRHVSGSVFYGKKANKAAGWIRELAKLHGGVDVASVQELAHSLAHGMRGTAIVVTGAAKSNELLWLSTMHQCTIAIDALDELERLIAIAASTGITRVLLRVLPPGAPNSRFGLNPDDLRIALGRCIEHSDLIEMRGFSFHLDGYLAEPRAQLAAALIEKCIEAREQGLAARSISIGGGFACAYVGEVEWKKFQASPAPQRFHAEKKFERFYPYFQAPTGADMLDAILTARVSNSFLASRLVEADIELCIEPGRALLDGAGFSVFPVQGFKRNSDHGIVTVSGLSMSVSEQWKNSEFLPTPILVQHGPPRAQNPVRVAIGGSSCMEYDMLTWRKVLMPASPRYGDLLIYPNTAGYQMDKNESEFHQLPLPPKVIVFQQGAGFSWQKDFE